MDPLTLTWIGIAILFVAVLATAFGYAVLSGLLTDIKISTGKPAVKNITIAYKFQRGSYKNCGALFSEACSLAPNLRCIAAYYDDPRQVPDEKLRSAVGCIVAEGDEQPDPQVVKAFTDHQFSLFTVPEAKTVFYTTFPFTGSLSVIISVYRVYPALADYAEANRLKACPYMEIYNSDTIYFMAVLDKNDERKPSKEFFVPEALTAELEDQAAEAEKAKGDNGSESVVNQ